MNQFGTRSIPTVIVDIYLNQSFLCAQKTKQHESFHQALLLSSPMHFADSPLRGQPPIGWVWNIHGLAGCYVIARRHTHTSNMIANPKRMIPNSNDQPEASAASPSAQQQASTCKRELIAANSKYLHPHRSPIHPTLSPVIDNQANAYQPLT